MIFVLIGKNECWVYSNQWWYLSNLDLYCVLSTCWLSNKLSTYFDNQEPLQGRWAFHHNGTYSVHLLCQQGASTNCPLHFCVSYLNWTDITDSQEHKVNNPTKSRLTFVKRTNLTIYTENNDICIMRKVNLCYKCHYTNNDVQPGG